MEMSMKENVNLEKKKDKESKSIMKELHMLENLKIHGNMVKECTKMIIMG